MLVSRVNLGGLWDANKEASLLFETGESYCVPQSPSRRVSNQVFSEELVYSPSMQVGHIFAPLDTT